MCGIAGVVGRALEPAEIERRLERMLPGIATRGPDGVGRLVAPGVGLLHTRLAIIDLVTGDQPIWNEARSVACIFNGEIYNYRALQDRLRERGHTMATRSDTETLVHLYEDYGPELVRHIHGMYALAIYDVRAQTLLLARDRLGIKPLYVAQGRDGVVSFASGIDSLLAAGASRDPDPEAIVQFLRFCRVPEPRTAYREVRALLPGHRMLVDVCAGTTREERFYALPPESAPERDAAPALADARAALRRSIERHLIADVEVAAFLSGGIDSSLVVAEAQRASSRPLRTFCVSFAGVEGYDEREFAERVARHLGTRHETIEVSAAPAELVRSALRAVQQPFAVASFLPLLLLCQRAASQVKVVLTGDGGDEVAFGYPAYRWMRATGWIPRLHDHEMAPRVLRAMERVAAGRGLHRTRKALKFGRGLLSSSVARTADAWKFEIDAQEATSLLQRDLRPAAPPPSPGEAVWSDRLDAASALRRSDLEVLLRDEMLPKLDRAGMAFGLEGRVPLLDDDFVEAMMRVPMRVHLADREGKAVLREWARELVPGVDADRPKHGFDVPMGRWLQGGLRDDVDRLLLDRSRRGLIDRESAAHVWRRVEGGTPGAAHTAYALLMAEMWFEEWAAR
jgi:asparagine synthase (glutamine-hydrolysing)